MILKKGSFFRIYQAVFKAVAGDHIEMIEMLLEHGEPDGSCFEVLAKTGRLEHTKKLKAKLCQQYFEGVDIATLEGGWLFQDHDEILKQSASLAIRWAAANGDLELVKTFKGQKYDIVFQQKILQSAIENGHFDIVRYLMTEEGFRGLHLDCLEKLLRRGYLQRVEELLLQPEIPSLELYVIWRVAENAPYLEDLLCLLRSHPNKFRGSPQFAAYANDIETVKFFHEQHNQPSSEDVLYAAVSSPKEGLETLRYLLQRTKRSIGNVKNLWLFEYGDPSKVEFAVNSKRIKIDEDALTATICGGKNFRIVLESWNRPVREYYLELAVKNGRCEALSALLDRFQGKKRFQMKEKWSVDKEGMYEEDLLAFMAASGMEESLENFSLYDRIDHSFHAKRKLPALACHLFLHERLGRQLQWPVTLSSAFPHMPLPVLKYMHENCGLEIPTHDRSTVQEIDVQQYLLPLLGPVFDEASGTASCSSVPRKDSVLRFLVENAGFASIPFIMDMAAHDGLFTAVQYLNDKAPRGCSVHAIDRAAQNGHLPIVKFLNENRKEGCSKEAVIQAAQNGHFEVVFYLIHNLPLYRYIDFGNGYFHLQRILDVVSKA
ncbi:hypothetical protein HDU97_001446 [Phlyctochytrium planicorne]|nr:hypothetical protein HDU97_001446 [Phlyctochytrium planicorne]